MSAAAIMVVLCGSMAQAAVITASYVNIQTSDNVNFNAAGNLANFGTNTAALSSLPAGKFFRFGLSVVVSGNSNPASAVWDGTPTPQPTNLGAAIMSARVLSTDPAGSLIASIQGAPRTNPPDSRNTSKASIVGGSTAWGFFTEPGDALGNANVGTTNALGSGQIGSQFAIASANSTGTPTAITQLASPGSVWVNSLTFQALSNADGLVTLSPVLVASGINLWHNTSVGDPGDPTDVGDDVAPTYVSDPFSATFGPEADSIVNAPPLAITVLGGAIPEPATAGMVGLALLGLVGRRRSK